MAKGAISQFISPAQLAEIKAELQGLSKLEPGAKTVQDAVKELIPIIRGCRVRGHSWKRISESFSRVEGISAASLRKYAYELDPSLKKPVKGIVPKAKKSSDPVKVIEPTIKPEPSPKTKSPDPKKVRF